MQRIQRQDPEDMHLAHDALAWIIKAKEPLTVSALTQALGILEGDTQFHEDGVPDPDSIISVCAGLVTTHRRLSGNVEFGLAHPTLTEFFHENPQLLSHKLQLLPQTCLRYLTIALSQVDFPQNEEDYRSLVIYHSINTSNDLPKKKEDYRSWVQSTIAPWQLTYPLLRYACKY